MGSFYAKFDCEQSYEFPAKLCVSVSVIWRETYECRASGPGSMAGRHVEHGWASHRHSSP